MTEMTKAKKFEKERNNALFSLNEKRIKRYMKKYKIKIRQNPTMFWNGVYRAICHIPSAPKDVRDKAEAWIAEYNSLFADEEEC